MDAWLAIASKREVRAYADTPIPDEIGVKIYERICAACWKLWFPDLSTKVINELRLDLSSEFGQSEYDRHMIEFCGFED